MIVKTVRMPGQKGTRRLVEKFGNKLVCVRYRYDYEQGMRYKTAEIIVAEAAWQPPVQEPRPAPVTKIKTTPYVGLKIHYSEKSLRDDLKAIGAHWSPGDRLWYAPEEYVKRIGLTDRIVKRG
jgi:hypothetical protein